MRDHRSADHKALWFTWVGWLRRAKKPVLIVSLFDFAALLFYYWTEAYKFHYVPEPQAMLAMVATVVCDKRKRIESVDQRVLT